MGKASKIIYLIFKFSKRRHKASLKISSNLVQQLAWTMTVSVVSFLTDGDWFHLTVSAIFSILMTYLAIYLEEKADAIT